MYGTDGSQNAVHGSDSKDSAAREKKVIFGESQHKVTDSDTADLNEEVFTLATEQVHIPGEFPEDIVQSIMERSEVEEEARLSHATSEASESLDIAVAVPTSPDTFEPNLPDNYGITETTTHTQRLLNYPGEQELKNSISGTEVQQLEEVAQNLESLTGEWVKFAADEAEEAIKLAKSIQRPLSPAQMKEIFQNVESLTGEPVNLSLEEVEATEKLISHTFETPERTNLPQVVDEDSNFAIDIEETIEAVEDPKLFEEMLVLDTEKKSLQKDVVEPINMIERPLSTAQVEEVIQNIESLMGEPVKLSSDEVEILKTNIDVINVDLNTKDFDQEAMEIAEAEIAAIVQSLSPPEVEKVVESADLEVIEVEQQKEDDLQRPVIPLDLSRPLSPAEVQEVIQNIQFFTGEIVSEAEVEAIQTSVENEEEIVIVPQILPLTSNKDVFSAEVEASELARTLESVAPEKLDAIEANSESEESEILTPAEIEEIQKSSRFVEAALKESLSEEQLNQFPDNLEKKNSDVLLEAIPAGVKDLTPLLNLHDKGNSSTSENGEKEDAITPEKLELVTSDQSNEILADGHQDDEMDKLGLQSFDEGDSHGDLMPMQPNTSRNFEFQAAANSGQLQSAETQVQEADVEITVPVNLKGKGAEDYKFTAIPRTSFNSY